jgi:hypothetical protein
LSGRSKDEICASLLPNGLEQDAVSDVFGVASFECRFWDEVLEVFISDGCHVADSNFTSPNGQRSVKCQCNHLTEFAIVESITETRSGLKCGRSVFGSIIFLIFAIIYFSFLLLTFYVCLQFAKYLALWQLSKLKSYYVLCFQFILVATVASLRVILCLIYFYLQYESVQKTIRLKAVGFMSGVIYILLLWTFMLLVFSWAAAYNSSKERRHSQPDVPRSFLSSTSSSLADYAHIPDFDLGQ